MRRTADRVDVHRGVERGDIRPVLDVGLDDLVAQLVDEVGLPVLLESRRQQGVEHALQHRERHRPHELEDGRAEPSQRPDSLFRLVHRPGVAADDAAHGLVVQMLGERRSRRHDQVREERVHVLRRLAP